MGLPRLDFISLKLRVSLGFIFICIILVVGGLFSYLGFSKSNDFLLELTSISEQAKLHSSIEKNVLEIQGRVQQFIYQGRKSTADKVYSLSKNLMADLEIAHKLAKDNTAENTITNTIEHFNLYLYAFDQVVEERELRTTLVEVKLTEYIERSQESILEYIKLGEEKVHVDGISKGYIIMNTLLNIEKCTSTYFSTLDSSLVTKTKGLFDNIKSGISELIDDEKEKGEGGLILQKMQIILSKYETGSFRAIQATRGYLYLVNVVLAGEASAILYNTNRLKNISADDLDIVHKQSSLLIQSYIFITIIITIVAVTMGIIISWLIAHSVTTPINRLTGVFELLVKGDYRSEIPGRDFKDEIGDLSRAAEVFKNKNIQTELLLEQSNALTRELEDKRKELAKSNESLEHRVSERTEEIKGNNIKLIKKITENKRAEKQIKASLKEKEVLLAEIHHRVKNNLQIVSSMLHLQSNLTKDNKITEIMDDSQHRIQSMALVHETLYESHDFSEITIQHYLDELVRRLIAAYEQKTGTVTTKIEAEGIQLSIDTVIPIGLITNELITNSMKYAFQERKDNEIKVILNSTEVEGEFELIISDNGIGIQEDIDIRNSKTLGLLLVTNVVELQLSGKLEVKRDKGTEFKIRFKEISKPHKMIANKLFNASLE
ncbi:MAG: HAMP domain-containing protein [Candidatus Scalindua sp.]|jgi:two-component sensor histidine kinase/CHASE3 domain sensor protein|nr:HAMP domain-containing protein [Candidatus Scalindua sp.]MBT6562405.1 HAMP domain-containing protein [Candidatus Scalindua sp.]